MPRRMGACLDPHDGQIRSWEHCVELTPAIPGSGNLLTPQSTLAGLGGFSVCMGVVGNAWWCHISPRVHISVITPAPAAKMPVFGAFWRRKVTNFCFHTKTRWKAPLCDTTAISIDQKRFSWAIPRSRGPSGFLAYARARLVRGNGRSHKRPCGCAQTPEASCTSHGTMPSSHT